MMAASSAQHESVSFLGATSNAVLENQESQKQKRAAAEKAAAAAAARRKRRRALVRRTHSPRNMPRKVLKPAPQPSTNVVTIQPTVAGVQEVSRRWRDGDAVAIPTECTYEAYLRLSSSHLEWTQRLRKLQMSTSNNTPHIYVPASMESKYLKKELPSRHYAMRDKNGKITSLHNFSEPMQVLKRIATRVWPGPLAIHVSCSDTADPSLRVRRQGVDYLKLRCPCHPLAIKVYHEYRRQTELDSQDVLVGLALQEETNYVTAAASVVVRSLPGDTPCPAAVLNGEERKEIFAVPTCEHAEPWPVTLWVDGNKRSITIVGKQPEDTTVVPFTADHIRSALRQLPKSKSVKDRMIQAVLGKWNVEHEEE